MWCNTAYKPCYALPFVFFAQVHHFILPKSLKTLQHAKSSSSSMCCISLYNIKLCKGSDNPKTSGNTPKTSCFILFFCSLQTYVLCLEILTSYSTTRLCCVNDIWDINTASTLSLLYLYYYSESLAPIMPYVTLSHHSLDLMWKCIKRPSRIAINTLTFPTNTAHLSLPSLEPVLKASSVPNISALLILYSLTHWPSAPLVIQ